LSPDAFIHLPTLFGRLIPPEQSALRFTPEVLAAWDERARELGRPADWRLSDQQIEDSRRRMLGELPRGQDLWIFSYGSLMWDPGFHFAEVRLADLAGHQRRFTFRTQVGRGSPERPGLMLSLATCPGRCLGLAFRIAPDLAEAESSLLWCREMLRGSYRPAFLPVDTPQGRVAALVFGQNPAHADHVGELPLDETAKIIATGAGVLGTNREYLEQLAAQLERLAIGDEYIARLQERVRRFAGQ